MDFLFDINIWASFLSLFVLEAILGIDNLVFISILVSRLPDADKKRVRTIGLSLAFLMRIGMILGLGVLMSMNKPFTTILGFEISGHFLLMLFGGLFLIYKATVDIHEEVGGEIKSEYKAFTGTVSAAIMQIILIDFVFSFDSVLTAIGLTKNIGVIIAAMGLAMVVMLVSINKVSEFIEKYPSLKMLALTFIMLIGVLLVGEAFHFEIPKAYIYFAMGFSMGVEVLNIISRNKRTKKK